MQKLGVSPDTVGSTHEYCIDWSEDQLSWSVDGKVGRTVKRTDSWNATAGRFDYPQTPSRIMLSLWPAGLPSNGKGTIEWSGGEIDWNSKYMTNGMYAALVTKVTVDCYDAPSGIQSTGSKSYKYTSNMPTNNTVEMTNDLVVLGSLTDTGDAPGNSGSASRTGSAAQSTKSVNSVPGGNPGGGSRQDTPVSGPNGAQTTGSSSSSSGSNGGTDTGSTGSSGSTGGGSFVQGDGHSSGSGSGAAALEPGLAKVGGSAIAIVFAIFGLLVL